MAACERGMESRFFCPCLGQLKSQTASLLPTCTADPRCSMPSISFCHAPRPTASSNPALQAWECQLSAQTWERCQQLLFRHALQPHPLTAHVLGSVWSDLAAAASEALLQSHVTMLHDLLRLTAAAEAVAGGHMPPSPLHMQLLGLVACLLAAAPPAMLDAYYANFLQVWCSWLGSMGLADRKAVACKPAELRARAERGVVRHCGAGGLCQKCLEVAAWELITAGKGCNHGR